MRVKRRAYKSEALRNMSGLLFLIVALTIAVYISSVKITSQFPIKHILFMGNRHITDDELMELSGIQSDDSLVTISHREVSRGLLKSPWIRSVSVRKEFPESLSVMLEETIPFALLDMNGHLLLVDEEGELLEELRDDSIPFLPVITGDPFKEPKEFAAALTLAKTMNDMGFSSERDTIEIIISKPHELTAVLDGTIVKVGSGDFAEKMERLLELEEEIKKRKIPVDYIDVRFANRVVVKPIKEIVK